VRPQLTSLYVHLHLHYNLGFDLGVLHNTINLEKVLLTLLHAHEYRRTTLQNNECMKKHWIHYNQQVLTRAFHEGDLILAFDPTKENLCTGKFESL
jgi:hypothetical protein